MPQDAGHAFCRCVMTCAYEFAWEIAAQYKSLVVIKDSVPHHSVTSTYIVTSILFRLSIVQLPMDYGGTEKNGGHSARTSPEIIYKPTGQGNVRTVGKGYEVILNH